MVNLGKADASTYGTLYLGDASGAGSLTGSGTITFGGSTNNGVLNDSNAIGDAGILTIGSGITIRGKSGRVNNSNQTGEVVNLGSIIADTSGGTVTLGGAGTFTNSGSVSVLSGAILNFAGSWGSTSGSIAVNNGTLNLGGGVSTSALNLPAFTRTGGTVNLTGTLDNFGATLTLTPVTGDWNLINGLIRNGTIASTGGTLLIQSGTLDGVTVTGGVDLSSINGANVTVKNGMVLNSTINNIWNHVLRRRERVRQAAGDGNDPAGREHEQRRAERLERDRQRR